jgi:UDP:flavonoid glycosyltransferase YjiC (YdhE family)
VLATIGSLGDLHPCLALAIGLRQRGHRPVIASTALYRAKVEALGFEFHSLRPDTGAQDPETMRILMDMRRGPEFLLRRLILPAIRDTYADLAAVATGADLLIAGEIVFAAPLVAEKLGIPWVSAILSPFSFFSAHDPSVSPLAPSMGFLYRAGSPLHRFFLKMGRLATHPWWAPVRHLRRELGLGKARNPIFYDKFSPDLTLALFSKELARPQEDWPAKTLQTGFVFYDGGESQDDLSPGMKSFLREGEKPIVFTLGSSAVHDPRTFFDESVEAARILGRRAIFLTGENPAPAGIASDAFAAPYAPFSKLFPEAAVVVHQGGVGTTAHSLLAGRPALIMPCGFDQPDNAARVQRLGAGLTLSRNGYGARTAARQLQRLLGDPQYARAAHSIAARLREENGLERACDAIEELASGVRSPVELPVLGAG